MQGHVVALLAAHNITVEWQEGYTGRSWRRKRHVKLRPVRGTGSYYIALHEVGHIVGKRQGYAIRRLDKEAYAWQWALDNALCPPDARAARSIGTGLHSYLLWAWHRQDRKRGRPWLPPRQHLFWQLYLRYYSNRTDYEPRVYMDLVLG